VAPAGNRDRVVLNRAESTEELEDGVGATLDGSRRREEVPGNEESARCLSGDPHLEGR